MVFRDPLGCGPAATVEFPGIAEPMLVVRFPDGGSLSIEFTDQAPDHERPRLGAWLELRAEDPAAVMRAALDAGLPEARLIASRIPRARLRILPGRSHLPYIGDVDALVATARDFLGLPPRHRPTAPTLTKRQREVAALVTEGLTNKEIGQRLGIDEHSAEGTLSASTSGSDSAPGHRSRPSGWRRAPESSATGDPRRRPGRCSTR